MVNYTMENIWYYVEFHSPQERKRQAEVARIAKEWADEARFELAAALGYYFTQAVPHD